jgi:malonyl-CoA O-methyltransferase
MKNPLSIDRLSVARQFDRRANRLAEVDFLLREVQRRMFSRLEYIKIEPSVVLDVGCGLGHCAQGLAARFPVAQVVAVDLSQNMVREATRQQSQKANASKRQVGRSEGSLAAVLAGALPSSIGGFFSKILGGNLPQAAAVPEKQQNPVQFLVADSHSLPLATGSVDLVFSNLALHWFDDPVSAIAEWRRVIKPGGLVMFSSFGPDTLKEVGALGVQLPTFQDLHDLGDALQTQKFAEPVMDMEALSISYQDPQRLLADLRNLGGYPLRQRHSGLRGRQFTKTIINSLSKLTPGVVSFELVYGHAWAPKGPWLPEGYAPIEFRPRATA